MPSYRDLRPFRPRRWILGEPDPYPLCVCCQGPFYRTALDERGRCLLCAQGRKPGCSGCIRISEPAPPVLVERAP